MARINGPLVICVINMKGGVGKSTITALLSRFAFQTRTLDVLAVDLDPQANLSQALMGYSYTAFLANKEPCIVEIFSRYRPPSGATRHPSSLSPSDVVQTIGTLGTNTLQLIPSRFDFADNLTQSVRPEPRVLARFLSSEFRHKDIILIDCAPIESVLTLAAYHASGLVLVPVKPEYFATIGFPLLKESLDQFTRRNKSHVIGVTGVVINNDFYHGGNNGGPEKHRAIADIRSESPTRNSC
jgi:chromosome partitioning protein